MAQDISGTHLATTWRGPVSVPSVKVYVDWDGDGDFLDTYEDVTSHVLSVNIGISALDPLYGLPVLGGANYGTAEVVLANVDRFYSLTNTSGIVSAYPGLLDTLYGKRVRIEAGYEYLGTPERLVQFMGGIEGYSEHETAQNATVTLHCRDMSYLLAQAKVTGPLWQDYRTDEVIDAILDLAGFPSSLRDLDKGMSVIPYSYTEKENAWETCVRVAQSEGGFFFMGKDGSATFRRFTAPLERNPAPVVDIDHGTILAYGSQISWREVYTRVSCTYQDFLDFPIEPIWKSERYVAVPPGQTRVLDIIYDAPSLDVVSPEDGVDFVCVTSGGRPLLVSSGDISVSLTAYATNGRLSLTNLSHQTTAYFINLQVRGRPIRSSGILEYYLEDPSSGLKKEISLADPPYLQSRAQAERLVGYVYEQVRCPLRVLTWEGPLIPWIELLDLVHVSHHVIDPNPGVDLDAYVLGYQISLAGFAKHSLTLIPKEDLFAHDDYFILGTSTYSDSTSDKAGY